MLEVCPTYSDKSVNYFGAVNFLSQNTPDAVVYLLCRVYPSKFTAASRGFPAAARFP